MQQTIESGSQIYNLKIKNLAITGICKEYESVPKKDVEKLFNYLENYCKIINGGKIPHKVFQSAAPCSVYYIRNKILNFFESYLYQYKEMTTIQIVKKLIGEKEYDNVLTKYFNNDEADEEMQLETINYPIQGTMEEVDGGAVKGKGKRKRKTKRRVKKTRKNKTRTRR